MRKPFGRGDFVAAAVGRCRAGILRAPPMASRWVIRLNGEATGVRGACRVLDQRV
ncbi:hypothetical protein I551_4664 [Mycobacterium ulcerans str. Harvey]|uniref:Uncharacterized protein n=1 Tax=Mycobacterium ulcerans str. Harvey TaxID=1299332 RepID=A0ABP3ABX1_MYCUL|nr:hypothetical protein I551_4664 [Mycobacterium ulcerans str. Harvey]